MTKTHFYTRVRGQRVDKNIYKRTFQAQKKGYDDKDVSKMSPKAKL
jgi:hypothetical protein